ANRGISDQARITRKLYSDACRNRDARCGIRARAKSDNDRFRSAKFSSRFLKVLEKRCGIFSVVRPFARELSFAAQPNETAARTGKFKCESFHQGDEAAL